MHKACAYTCLKLNGRCPFCRKDHTNRILRRDKDLPLVTGEKINDPRYFMHVGTVFLWTWIDIIEFENHIRINIRRGAFHGREIFGIHVPQFDERIRRYVRNG